MASKQSNESHVSVPSISSGLPPPISGTSQSVWEGANQVLPPMLQQAAPLGQTFPSHYPQPGAGQMQQIQSVTQFPLQYPQPDARQPQQTQSGMNFPLSFPSQYPQPGASQPQQTQSGVFLSFPLSSSPSQYPQPGASQPQQTQSGMNFPLSFPSQYPQPGASQPQQTQSGMNFPLSLSSQYPQPGASQPQQTQSGMNLSFPSSSFPSHFPTSVANQPHQTHSGYIPQSQTFPSQYPQPGASQLPQTQTGFIPQSQTFPSQYPQPGASQPLQTQSGFALQVVHWQYPQPSVSQPQQVQNGFLQTLPPQNPQPGSNYQPNSGAFPLPQQASHPAGFSYPPHVIHAGFPNAQSAIPMPYQAPPMGGWLGSQFQTLPIAHSPQPAQTGAPPTVTNQSQIQHAAQPQVPTGPVCPIPHAWYGSQHLTSHGMNPPYPNIQGPMQLPIGYGYVNGYPYPTNVVQQTTSSAANPAAPDVVAVNQAPIQASSVEQDEQVMLDQSLSLTREPPTLRSSKQTADPASIIELRESDPPKRVAAEQKRSTKKPAARWSRAHMPTVIDAQQLRRPIKYEPLKQNSAKREIHIDTTAAPLFGASKAFFPSKYCFKHHLPQLSLPCSVESIGKSNEYFSFPWNVPDGYGGLPKDINPQSLDEVLLEVKYISNSLPNFSNFVSYRDKFMKDLQLTVYKAINIGLINLQGNSDPLAKDFDAALRTSNILAHQLIVNYQRTAKHCYHIVVHKMCNEVRKDPNHQALTGELMDDPEFHSFFDLLKVREANSKVEAPQAINMLWRKFVEIMTSHADKFISGSAELLQNFSRFEPLFPPNLPWAHYQNVLAEHQMQIEDVGQRVGAIPKISYPEVATPAKDIANILGNLPRHGSVPQ